jgi:glycine/D-amino acid oxidase-like deaminating enzyme
MRLYHPSAFDFSTPVDSHWQASAPPLERACPRLDGSVTAEVAIIGAGYAGLNAALRLASAHGIKAVVLDAARPGWGASGRNGGFCCLGSSKLSYHQMIARYGLDETRRFHAAQLASIAHVAALLERHGIDAERCGSGDWALAHRANRMAGLAAERDFMRATFGLEMELVDRDELAGRGLAGPQFHGGLYSRIEFGLHPLRYVLGLARTVIDSGVVVHGDSPVTAWRSEAGGHVLETPGGEVRAKKVVLATNGYSDDQVPEWLGGRLLPALSRIIVTRPLSADERSRQGWTSHDLAYDTRDLLHYFRLLPDNRFLFGGRGGTDASPAGLDAITRQLRARFEAMFPAWAGVPTERAWAGLVCLARRRVPFVGAIEEMPGAFAALAWHGNGVAMASYGGRLIADLMAGAKGAGAAIPGIVGQAPARFALPGLRRFYLKAAYAGFGMRDEWL